MSELEDRLRREVTRHGQEFSPSADLPERIHTQVRRRRRQRRVLVGAASGGALAAVVVAAVVLIRPAPEIESTDPGPSAVTTVRPDGTGTAEPTETAPSVTTTDPSVTTEPTESPDTTRPPDATSDTTQPPETTETTESTTTDTTEPQGGPLKPPDGDQPTSGCTPAGEVALGAEGPAPACIRVTADQRLQVRNDTDQQVTVSVGGWVTGTVEPGQSGVVGGRFGGYLEPGVHRVTVSPYPHPGPEIWLAP